MKMWGLQEATAIDGTRESLISISSRFRVSIKTMTIAPLLIQDSNKPARKRRQCSNSLKMRWHPKWSFLSSIMNATSQFLWLKRWTSEKKRWNTTSWSHSTSKIKVIKKRTLKKTISKAFTHRFLQGIKIFRRIKRKFSSRLSKLGILIEIIRDREDHHTIFCNRNIRDLQCQTRRVFKLQITLSAAWVTSTKIPTIWALMKMSKLMVSKVPLRMVSEIHLPQWGRN